MESSALAEKLPSERKANILLVDDQPANLLVLRAILEDLNQNLVDAHSGDEALRWLLEDDFAVVLLDVKMPGRSGFETAKLIREREKNRHTPIIFLTAYDSDRLTLETAYSLGAVDFLVKPLIPVILKAKVKGFVELYEKTAQVQRQAEQLRQVERREFERVLAEENARLRESEEKLRLLADTIPQMAWMARPDGYTFWYNRRWYEYTGTTLEQMKGEGWHSVHDPEVLPKVLERWTNSIATGEPFEMVFPMKGADDGFRQFLTRVNPLKDGEGRVLGWFGTNTDISEIKCMEEALRESDRRKDEFLATLAHELRNPLAPLVNGLEIINLAPNDGRAIKQSLAIMERQLTQLVRLVDDLMDVSRINQGKIDLRKERIELAKVVEHAVETSRPLIEASGHDLTINLPPDPIYVAADGIRLAQVLTNLLNNAAKYTERGGRITLAVERQGSDAVASVRDTGIGIPAHMLPKLFEIFTQVDRSLERSQGGLGIGLSLVKGLVEMHGGRIEARSEGPGKGAEFVVRLPVVEGPVQAQVELSRDDMKSRSERTFRILVADDNRDAVASLAMMLRLMGHEIQTASDGDEALKAAAAFQPDLALLDIGMPKLNGYDAALHIRQEPWGKKMVLVALTGWGQEEDKRRATEVGFDHHMTKPVSMDALQKLLASINMTESKSAT